MSCAKNNCLESNPKMGSIYACCLFDTLQVQLPLRCAKAARFLTVPTGRTSSDWSRHARYRTSSSRSSGRRSAESTSGGRSAPCKRNGGYQTYGHRGNRTRGLLQREFVRRTVSLGRRGMWAREKDSRARPEQREAGAAGFRRQGGSDLCRSLG